MKITKYEHACLVVEDNGKQIVIDPGVFSKSLATDVKYDAAVITHVHSDHMDIETLQKLKSSNPEMRIFSVQQAANDLIKNSLDCEVVGAGDTAVVGDFNLEFFGGQHAIIHPDFPRFENVGVMVSERFYYPGDSFTKPEKPVEILAVPYSGPWLKTGESMDFISQVNPKRCFPTHDYLSSKDGAKFVNNWLRQICEQKGIVFEVIETSQSLGA